MTIDARLPTVVNFQGIQEPDQVAGSGHPCNNVTEERYQLGCPAQSPLPAGMNLEARLQGPEPLLSEPSQSGAKLVQVKNQYWKAMVAGNLMCAISTDQNPSVPYQLDADPLEDAFHTFVNTGFNLTAAVEDADVLDIEAQEVNYQYETYVVYYVSTNGDPNDTRLQMPLSKLTWNWGGLVAFDPNGFWNIRMHYGPDIPNTLVLGTPASSMLPTHGPVGPVPMLCPGAIGTSYDVDGARFFVTVLYLSFYGHAPDVGGGRFWTSQITQCVFDFACRDARRTDVAYAFFTAPETLQRYPDIGNPPGSPGFNATTYNPAFVTESYQRLLGRAPDPGGYSYWLGELNDGRITYEQLTGAFINCPEFHGVWG